MPQRILHTRMHTPCIHQLRKRGEMPDALSFGHWLKQRRKALDLTQQELAQRVCCARITIQKIELGERHPSLGIAELLADHLAIAPEEHTAFLRFARALPSEPTPAVP